MKISFKDKETDNSFKEFVCENKNVLNVLLSYLSLAKNPIIRIVANALSQIIAVACPEKKTKK